MQHLNIWQICRFGIPLLVLLINNKDSRIIVLLILHKSEITYISLRCMAA
jgi:hypothetical protein